MDIAFADRTVTLDRIDQSRTYSGLLEGIPNVRLNAQLIAEAINNAARSGATLLIEPRRVPIPSSAGSEHFGPHEKIPRICCTVSFLSTSVARNQAMDASALTVVWFQDAWALPIAPEILTQLAATTWAPHAQDFEY